MEYIDNDGLRDNTNLLSPIKQNDRAILRLPALTRIFADQLKEILEAGKRLNRCRGNHCRGDKFVDLHARIKLFK